MDEKRVSTMASFKVFKKTTENGLKIAYLRGVKESSLLVLKEKTEKFETPEKVEETKEICIIPKEIDVRFNETEQEYMNFSNKWDSLKKKPIFSNKVVNCEYKRSFSTDDYSLVVCVSEDFCMKTGIEFEFRIVFQKLAQLLNQHQKCGGMALLKDGFENRFVYYLIVRKLYSHNMSFFNLFSGLLLMKSHIKENKVEKLAIPDVTSWLKKNERLKVLYLLEYLFRDINVEIVWCNSLVENLEMAPPLVKLIEVSNFVNIDHHFTLAKNMSNNQGTIIIYLSSEDGFVSNEMNVLDRDFKFLNNFKRAFKIIGNVIEHETTKLFKLYGCIVKRKWNEDKFDFLSLQNCFNFIRLNRKLIFKNFLLFNIFDQFDQIINVKIINLLNNTFYFDNINIFFYKNY